MKAGKHDIYIFWDDETKIYVVCPKVAVVSKGAKTPVRFRNFAPDEVTLVLPAGLFDGSQPPNVPGSGHRAFPLHPDVVQGEYDYIVIVKGQEADPKIIVDP